MFPHRVETKREKGETMSRIRKFAGPLITVMLALVAVIGFANPANAATSWNWKAGGNCSDMINRYQVQVSYGPHDVRMVTYASRSDNWTCTRVYAGGGQRIDTTMVLTRECATGNTQLDARRFTSYRTVALWVTRATAASCILTVTAWTNAGYGDEFTKVTTAHA
jgi:hypothetical protein